MGRQVAYSRSFPSFFLYEQYVLASNNRETRSPVGLNHSRFLLTRMFNYLWRSWQTPKQRVIKMFWTLSRILYNVFKIKVRLRSRPSGHYPHSRESCIPGSLPRKILLERQTRSRKASPWFFLHIIIKKVLSNLISSSLIRYSVRKEQLEN